MPQQETMGQGPKLKRLAKEYADAWADMRWIGVTDPADWDEIKATYKNARDKLHRGIDDALSMDNQQADTP